MSAEETVSKRTKTDKHQKRVYLPVVMLYLVLPALAIFLAVRVVIALIRLIKKRVKVRAYKPTSRYYR